MRVLARYGWAHSLSMETRPVGAKGEPGGAVVARCLSTPADRPFLVHAGEGVDERARLELTRLAESGCLRANCVLVHGVAHTVDTWRTAVAAGTGLVWCPVSNEFLFGRTLPLRELLDAVPESSAFVCLGSDSRLTGARDLLDELRRAKAIGQLPDGLLLAMVTENASRLLRLPSAGCLAPGAPADLVVLPAPAPDSRAEEALLAARRRDVSLVVIDGRPGIGALRMQPVFDARRVRTRRVIVDGAERLASADLIGRIESSPIGEAGVELGA